VALRGRPERIEHDAGLDAADLGRLNAFSGVSEFPARVKCATLAWHTLRARYPRPGPEPRTPVGREFWRFTLPRALTRDNVGCADQGYSDCGPADYRHPQGTSFSAPQVSAAAALLHHQSRLRVDGHPGNRRVSRRESLSEHRSDETGKDVAGPAGRQCHQPMAIDMRGVPGRGHHRLRALEHDGHPLRLREPLGHADTIGLDGTGVDAGEAAHFGGMGGHDDRMTMGSPIEACCRGDIEGVGVDDGRTGQIGEEVEQRRGGFWRAPEPGTDHQRIGAVHPLAKVREGLGA